MTYSTVQDVLIVLFILGVIISISESVLATFLFSFMYKYSIKKEIANDPLQNEILKKLKSKRKRKHKNFFGSYLIVPENNEILLRTNWSNMRFFHMCLGRMSIEGVEGNYKLVFRLHILYGPILFIISTLSMNIIDFVSKKIGGLNIYIILSICLLMTLALVVYLILREKKGLDFLYDFIKNELER